MKQTVLRPWTMAACVLAILPVHAQVTTPFNNGGTGDFVGWDNTMTNDPLQIRHDANQPIQWFTDAIQRMLLQETATYGIGQFNGQAKDGALLVCPDVAQFYANGAPGPYSQIHVAAADDNAQQDSYREWMNTGITFTGNRDHGYVGQKAGATDYTDMIVHWSEKQRLRRPRPDAQRKGLG